MVQPAQSKLSAKGKKKKKEEEIESEEDFLDQESTESSEEGEDDSLEDSESELEQEQPLVVEAAPSPPSKKILVTKPSSVNKKKSSANNAVSSSSGSSASCADPVAGTGKLKRRSVILDDDSDDFEDVSPPVKKATTAASNPAQKAAPASSSSSKPPSPPPAVAAKRASPSSKTSPISKKRKVALGPEGQGRSPTSVTSATSVASSAADARNDDSDAEQAKGAPSPTVGAASSGAGSISPSSKLKGKISGSAPPAVPKAPAAAAVYKVKSGASPSGSTSNSNACANNKGNSTAAAPLLMKAAPSVVGAIPSLSFQGPPGGSALSGGGVAIEDITRGADVTTESAAKRLISKYLLQQNRPYSTIQIYDNLHHRIVKNVVDSVCEALSNQPGSSVVVKEFGKTKLYFADQRGMSGASASKLDSLDVEIKTVSAQVSMSQQEEAALHESIKRLYAEPTDSDLDQVLAQQEAYVGGLQAKVATLSSSTLAPDACSNAIKRYNWYRGKWAERKRIVGDMVEQIADGMEKKISVVTEQLGVVSDAEVNEQLPAIMVEKK